jgi:hypothetical protein
MIDRDLAALYGVETRTLNQAVRRNINRFPEDFMFQLTSDEMRDWMSQIVISNREKMGVRKRPLAFTEQGVAMLSSVLQSETAILVNIQIIRAFTKLRQLLTAHESILNRIAELEKNGNLQNKNIKLIFQYLQKLEKERNIEIKYKNRKKLGF